MSLGKVARKLKRVGKTAYQFRITSTFEYIELNCNGTWRPENLRIIWLRSHRRVQSIDVKWVPSEDRGPNGAVGRATFDPSFSVALIVTLYGIQDGGTKFEEKEYKYYIESDGPSGRKIVASFNIDVADYASMPSSKHTLDMSFKPVSKKVTKAVLGITLQSEFIKQGTALDDDMQSTFSAVSAGQDSLQFDDEEDESGPTHLSTVEEDHEQGLPQAIGEIENSLVTLGTGERLKRTTLPAQAPVKPQRHPSPHPTPDPSPPTTPESKRKEKTPEAEAQADRDKTPEAGGMNGAALVGAEGEGEERKESKKEKKEREKQEKEKQKREEKERKQNEKKEKEKEKKKPKDGENKEKSPAPEDTKKSSLPAEADTAQASAAANGIASTGRPDLVTVVEPPGQISGAGQPIGIVFDTTKAGEGQLSATCKGTKVGPIETDVTERTEGRYHVQFVPNKADVYMLSVQWGDKAVSGSPFLINLNLLPSPALPVKNKSTGEGEAAATSNGSPPKPQEKMSEEKKDGASGGGGEEEKEKEKEKEGKVEEGQGMKEDGEKKAEEKKEEEKEEDSTFVASDDPFEMAFLASRMLEQQQQKAQGSLEAAASPNKSGRTQVSSKEDWAPPSNHFYEEMPGEGDEEEEPQPSPLDTWLGDAPLIDCFGESVSRDKLESADIIGLYFSANWCPPCRRFLPKLVKFYHHLKQNQKSFELIYVSSDPSKQEMMKYMQEQQMPWVALAFDNTLADKLRVDYNVSAIPVLTIVSKGGVKLEERARKLVEQSTSSAAVLKLYSKWLEKSQQGEGTVEKKGGLLKTIKSAIQKPGKEQVSELPSPPLDSQHSQSQEEEKGGAGDSERITVEQRSRARTKPKGKDNLVTLTTQEMEEKEEKLRHLEEVNMSLKQTNDDLNEEVAELKRQIGEFQTKLEVLETSSRQMEDEKRELMANLNIRGWLLKRGIKGPTANVWRRRYFRCDQGSKIYYYKSASEGSPQGFIDLDKVVSVQEVSAAQQDKNHATFLVQCEGRTFQLQAHDETTMRKWMSAIEYLKNWRQKNSAVSPGAHP